MIFRKIFLGSLKPIGKYSLYSMCGQQTRSKYSWFYFSCPLFTIPSRSKAYRIHCQARCRGPSCAMKEREGSNRSRFGGCCFWISWFVISTCHPKNQHNKKEEVVEEKKRKNQKRKIIPRPKTAAQYFWLLCQEPN